VTGPGRPAIAIVDFEAPLPEGEDLHAVTGALDATHRCERPLERFTIALDSTGEAHEDHSAPLRGERGEPVSVSLDLSWETDGTPYAYRMTTRYEIPCRVSGSVRIDEQELVLRGPGQRDHSWGVRDWWAMDWMWSAARLGDGARVHAVAIRLPGGMGFGTGYLQGARGELTELEQVEAAEQLGRDGLVRSARLALEPTSLAVAVEPLAYGPLRLVDRGGRVTSFHRAMCRFRSDDGRTGLGWAEWNLNQGRG
jgi:hypothetical protein